MVSDEKQPTHSYDRFKRHGGKAYSGMEVGHSHRWLYDQGEWRERKLSPDEWEIYYETVKRRTAHAPDESGAPIGTEYNWLIVTHQRVDKLDANSYMTRMEGKKFKIAHKRAGKDAWSATEKSQRKKVIQFLEKMIDELKQADESEDVPYSVGEHEHIYGLNLRTKAELLAMAKQYGIAGTSKMKREDLLEAVKTQVYAKRDSSSDALPRNESENYKTQLLSKTKSELFELASSYDLDIRSSLRKPELVDVLAKQMQRSEERPRALPN